MTYQDFLDCINKYKSALLKIIPAYYCKPSDNLVKTVSPKGLKDVVIHLKDKRLLSQRNKKKSASEIKEFLASDERKIMSSTYIGFIQKMKPVLKEIDSIPNEINLELFRFKFFEKEMDKNCIRNEMENNIISGSEEEMISSIFRWFEIYLRFLKDDDGYTKALTIEEVKKEMSKQEDEYIHKYGDRIKIFLGGKVNEDEKVENNESSLSKKIPKDTKWPDVEITFTDSEHVRVKAKGKVIEPRAHYSQMGFKHKNSAKHTKLWDTLRIFALHNGVITPKFDKEGKLIKTVGVDDVKRLRIKLKECFGISDNPIPPYDKGKYIKKDDGNKEHIDGEGYKTLFCIKDESSLQGSLNKNHSD